MEYIDCYKRAVTLFEAILCFGNSQLVAKLSAVSELNEKQTTSSSFLGILSQGIQNIQAIGQSEYTRQEIIKKIKTDIINRIQKGNLNALGLQLPINVESKPIPIPAHLFSGEIDWEKSELKFKNLEFVGIKILAFYANLEENKNLENFLPAPIKEINLANLDYDAYVTEKEAAKILGISTRTLQGYRAKGGGPEFHKFGRVVRYKNAELVRWADLRRKINTIG